MQKKWLTGALAAFFISRDDPDDALGGYHGQ